MDVPYSRDEVSPGVRIDGAERPKDGALGYSGVWGLEGRGQGQENSAEKREGVASVAGETQGRVGFGRRVGRTSRAAGGAALMQLRMSTSHTLHSLPVLRCQSPAGGPFASPLVLGATLCVFGGCSPLRAGSERG